MASIFSYVVKYHSKIASVVVILMALGVLNEFTEPVSSLFLSIHYEQVTEESDQSVWKIHYGTGLRDFFSVCLWFLVCVITKAFIQNNVLNKMHRKLHLSKSGKSKFFESGQLIIFNAASIIWTLTIIITENRFVDFSSLIGRQHKTMSLLEKLFYINQLAYWAHIIPELYCQKMKKKEISGRVKYSLLNLAFILTLYTSKLHCTGISVLLLHNISELTKRAFKLIDIIKIKSDIKKTHLARSVYRWSFLVIQSLMLILPREIKFYYNIFNMELGGESIDFKYHFFDILPIAGALAAQFFIICEFSSEKKISSVLCFNKRKDKADTIKYSLIKKREIAVKQKIEVPTEIDQKIKKELKKGVKKNLRNNA